MSDNHERSLLEQLTVQVASMQAKLDRILGQREIRSHYSVTEFAEEVNRSTETVEAWCRNGRIVGQRKKHGRGANKEWVIERSELERYRREGLLTPACAQNGVNAQRLDSASRLGR